MEMSFVKWWRIFLAPRLSIIYIIGANKLGTVIWIARVTGKRGLKEY
jgi:hypothetical protein